MKALFEHFWLTFGLLLLVAILDLICLPEYNFSAAFVIAIIYFGIGMKRKYNALKKENL